MVKERANDHTFPLIAMLMSKSIETFGFAAGDYINNVSQNLVKMWGEYNKFSIPLLLGPNSKLMNIM